MDKVNGYGMYHDYGGKGLKRNENPSKPEKRRNAISRLKQSSTAY